VKELKTERIPDYYKEEYLRTSRGVNFGHVLPAGIILSEELPKEIKEHITSQVKIGKGVISNIHWSDKKNIARTYSEDAGYIQLIFIDVIGEPYLINDVYIRIEYLTDILCKFLERLSYV